MNAKYSEVLCLVIIFCFMFLSYNFMIAPKFHYMGFIDNFDMYRFLLSASLFFITILFFMTVQNYFTKYILSLLIIFVLIPNFISYAFQDGGVRIPIWSFLSLLITTAILKYAPKLELARLKTNDSSYLLWGLLLLCLSMVIGAHGIKFNLDAFLFNVYDIRRESRENNTFISVYSYFWLAKVICPIAIIFALEQKRKILLYSSILVLLYLFMTTGHKSVFLSILIIFAFYFGPSSYKDKLKTILKYSVLMFILLRLISWFFDFYMPESLLVRRLFFIPALLNVYYFDFFQNDFTYYSSSYLSLFLDYPYDRSIPQVIGINYFNSEEMSANNGYLSDGFANLGDLGVFINIVFTSIFLKSFKDYNVEAKYSGLIFVVFYSIQGSAFSTVLFTHGGILLLMLIPFVLGRESA